MTKNFYEGRKKPQKPSASAPCSLMLCSALFLMQLLFRLEEEVSKLKGRRGGAPLALSNGISLVCWDLCSLKGHALILRLNTCSILIRCCLAFKILEWMLLVHASRKRVVSFKYMLHDLDYTQFKSQTYSVTAITAIKHKKNDYCLDIVGDHKAWDTLNSLFFPLVIMFFFMVFTLLLLS